MSNVNNTSMLNLNALNTDFRVESTKVNYNAESLNVDSATVNNQISQPTKQELTQAIEVLNQAAIIEQRSLSFSIDDLSGRSIIKVIDQKTEQLIRQIPSEELLKVAQDIKKLQEEMGQSLGLLIDRKV